MYPTSHAATAAGAGIALAVVFDNDDLVHLVLQHAALDPVSFVAVSRVNHAFRRVCQRDTEVLPPRHKARADWTRGCRRRGGRCTAAQHEEPAGGSWWLSCAGPWLIGVIL